MKTLLEIIDTTNEINILQTMEWDIVVPTTPKQ
jgi:hypothetical protein